MIKNRERLLRTWGSWPSIAGLMKLLQSQAILTKLKVGFLRIPEMLDEWYLKLQALNDRKLTEQELEQMHTQLQQNIISRIREVLKEDQKVKLILNLVLSLLLSD